MKVQAELATDSQSSTLVWLFMPLETSHVIFTIINTFILKTESISLIIFSDLHSDQMS